MRQMAMDTIWIGIHLALIACFISYEKWVQREKCPSKGTSTLYHSNIGVYSRRVTT